MITTCAAGRHLTVSGRHSQEMSVWHRLIGVAVEYANQYRESRMFMQDVVKELLLFGVFHSKLLF